MENKTISINWSHNVATITGFNPNTDKVLVNGVEYVEKKIETTEDYLKGHKASGLRAGDSVRVVRKAECFERRWDNYWTSYMDRFIDKVLEIKEDCGKDGFALWNEENTHASKFPYFVLEKVEEPAKKEVECYADVEKILAEKRGGEGWKITMIPRSKEVCDWIIAVFKLEETAYVLNEIEFKDVEWKYNDTFYIYFKNDKIGFGISAKSFLDGTTRFKSEQAAQRAIEILGEETIKMALK